MGVPLDFTVRYPNTNSGSGPIENGKYLARIISTERQEIRGGAGDCLLAVFEIAGGKYRGRRVFARYGLWHHDANMREIAHNVFSALCRALGLREVTNSQQLHDIPLYITIQTRQSSQDSKKIYENIVRYDRYDVSRADVPALRAAMRQATPAAQEPRQNAAAQSAAEQAPKEGEDDLPF